MRVIARHSRQWPYQAEGEWVIRPKRDIRANAAVVREMTLQSAKSVQLDVRFRVGLGRMLIDSFGGFGETKEQAITDAQQHFVLNAFHVILAACFAPSDKQRNLAR